MALSCHCGAEVTGHHRMDCGYYTAPPEQKGPDMSGELFSLPDYSGIISENDVRQYMEVIQQAFAVHVDRERIRHGLWKDYHAEDQCNQVKIKIDRVNRSLERLGLVATISGNEIKEFADQDEALKANILEELQDIINYSVFAHRILEGKV